MSLHRISAAEALAQWAGFDCVIDARSESEFAEDHLPGAVNWPTLNDEERHIVGTEYKQVSPFDARKRGAALAALNIARHVQNHVMQHPRGWRPLVYCWRGGQRSGSLSTVLGEIGFTVRVLDGGYRAFRREVLEQLQTLPATLQYRVLCGPTGSAKSRLLQALAYNHFAQHVGEDHVQQAVHDRVGTESALLQFLLQQAQRQRQWAQLGQGVSAQYEPLGHLCEECMHGRVPELVSAADDHRVAGRHGRAMLAVPAAGHGCQGRPFAGLFGCAEYRLEAQHMAAAAGHDGDVAARQRQRFGCRWRMHKGLALAHHMQADAAFARKAQRFGGRQSPQVQQPAAQARLQQYVGEQVHDGDSDQNNLGF